MQQLTNTGTSVVSLSCSPAVRHENEL